MKNFKNSKAVKIATGLLGLALSAMMIAPAIASADTTSACSYVFTKTLKVGVTDQEVWNLQKVLNMNAATQIAASGAGSPGMETKYFGAKTKAAVIKWQNMNAADVLTPAGLTAGTGLVGSMSRAKLNMMCSGGSTTTTTPGTGTTSTVPGCTSTTGYSPLTGQPCSSQTTTTTGGGAVSAALDASSPMGGLISPSGVATLGTFKLTNSGSAAAKVTMLKFKRTGISSDTTLNNVYLYDSKGNRLTDAASISTGVISFSDTAGLVVVPAMGTISVSVRGDIASGMNGQTIGVMLSDATADVGTVGGLPVSAAEHTLSTAPSGMASADFVGNTTPSTATIDPQNDFTVWQRSVSIGSRDALMSAIRFQQIGSVYQTDVVNFRLMVDGVQVGSAVPQSDANRFVSFNFASPVTLKAGTHVVKLVADVVNGSNRSFQFSLRRVVDVEIWDSQLPVVVTPTVSAGAFTAIDAGTMSISAGTLTISRASDSPSGNVVNNGSSVTLGKFTVRAAGEKMKVENLRVSHTPSDAVWTGIRNGSLFLNGVQIGSTQTIGSTATQFNLGSSMVLDPGVNYTLEVRGDVYNTNTAANTALVAGTTTVVNIAAGSSNVYRMSSLGYVSNASASGNTVTVAAGSLTLAKYSAYANQTVTIPQTAYKIGEYRVSAGNTEGVNIDTFSVDFTGSTDVTKFQSVYIVYGSKTTSAKATVSSTTNTFSVNEPLNVNGTMSVAVYATLPASMSAGNVVVTLLTVSGTSQSSAQAVSSSQVTGQTITIGTGSISSAVDASTPVSALVVANSMPKVASFKFTSSNDSFTIDELTAKLTNSTSSAAVVELVWKDGATEIARQSMNGMYATSTGLTVAVPANGSKVIDVYANLGGIGTGFASTSNNVGVTLDGFESMSSSGVKARDYNDRAGNAMYAFKTKPTITNVALPTTVLANGTQSIYQFSVTADAGGTVAWRTVKFTISSSTASVSGFALYDASNQSSALANTTCTLAGAVVTCTSTSDQEVSGSKTYVLKGTVAGTATNASISVNIASSGLGFTVSTDATTIQATAASFVWSDESSQPHSGTTQDWNNDFLVKNLPTDSLTMSK